MSEVFNAYARYYDLLYKDKDYAAEDSYIDDLIRKYRPGAKSILNLGCGTGKHDACFEKMGYSVCGVDLSDTMLVEAHKRAIPGKLEFFKGDVRTVDLHRKFDVVVSLFHVISYQTMDDDILAAFRTAERHLVSGGVFIFDFWHGLGVLNDPPVIRIKRLEDEAVRVVRIAEPVMKKDKNMVDVNYQIMILDKHSGQWSELQETHSMRYFFLPEIESYLLNAGFSSKDACEWMSDKRLSSGWYGLVVAEKKLEQ
jgi:SAM-dependent methyltransferase